MEPTAHQGHLSHVVLRGVLQRGNRVHWDSLFNREVLLQWSRDVLLPESVFVEVVVILVVSIRYIFFVLWPVSVISRCWWTIRFSKEINLGQLAKNLKPHHKCRSSMTNSCSTVYAEINYGGWKNVNFFLHEDWQLSLDPVGKESSMWKHVPRFSKTSCLSSINGKEKESVRL